MVIILNVSNGSIMMVGERLLQSNENAIKRIQLHYAVMTQGYMIIADGNPLETTKRETREFKTLDTAARFLFKM